MTYLELKMTLFFSEGSDIKMLIEYQNDMQENIDILFNTMHIETILITSCFWLIGNRLINAFVHPLSLFLFLSLNLAGKNKQ